MYYDLVVYRSMTRFITVIVGIKLHEKRSFPSLRLETLLLCQNLLGEKFHFSKLLSDIVLLPFILFGKDECRKGNGFINNAWLRNNEVLHWLYVEFVCCKHRFVALFVTFIAVVVC